VTPRLTTSAPGKLVLLGEYAVLFGGPAVVLAINRRATVTMTASDDELWSVRSPGLVTEKLRFELLPDGSQRWVESSDEKIHQLRLVGCILSALVRLGAVNPLHMNAAALEIDTLAFFEQTDHGSSKLGLGSSAALTVALASALVRWAGTEDVLADRFDWLRTLVNIHRDFQGGSGSGIDLAASLFGGALEYRLDENGLPVVARPLDLPEDLELLFVWTGRSADTSRFLKRLTERSAVNPRGIGRALDDLSEASQSGIQALDSSRTKALLDAVDGFGEGLEALGREAEMPIMSSEHKHLLSLARRWGISYKPSGAGGGDLGLCFSDDPHAIDRMTVAVREAGFETIDLSLDPRGIDEPGQNMEDSQAKGVYH